MKNLLTVVFAATVLSGCNPTLGGREKRVEISAGQLRGDDGQASRDSFRAMREAQALPQTKANLPLIISAYRRSLSVSPDPFAQVHLAKLLLSNDQPSEARAVLRKLKSEVDAGRVSFYSNDPGMGLEIAELSEKLGLKELSAATVAGFADGPIHQIDARFRLPELDHVPAHARTNGLFAAGVGKLRVHDNEGAVKLFEMVVAERPDWGTARFMLAYANSYAGHRQEADRGFADAKRFGFKRPSGL